MSGMLDSHDMISLLTLVEEAARSTEVAQVRIPGNQRDIVVHAYLGDMGQLEEPFVHLGQRRTAGCPPFPSNPLAGC